MQNNPKVKKSHMRKIMSVLLAVFTIGTSISFIAPSVSQAAPQQSVTSCTDLGDHTQAVLGSNKVTCPSLGAPAIWHMSTPGDTTHTGAGFANLQVCTSKNPSHSYQLIESVCPKYLTSTQYWRAVRLPTVPVILSSSAQGYNQIEITLAPPLASDAPVAFYLVTNTKTGTVTKVVANALHQLVISGLSPQTAYGFTVEAVNIDSGVTTLTPQSGSQAAPNSASLPITTATTIPLPPQVALPAFTLTYFIFPATSESANEGFAIRGFSANSTGGAVASYSISPAPTAGLSFNPTTGSLSGIPGVGTSGHVLYTVTATNAAGSATQTFGLVIRNDS